MSNEDLKSTDDPRLTAYVLGELREPQRTEFETELATSPRLQAALIELQQAAAQIFAALQTEPDIALTDEQLERIRTAAYAAPPISVPPTPARVAVIGNRPAPASSQKIASSAVVLAGLVLLTAALVLSAHFPPGGLVDHGIPDSLDLAVIQLNSDVTFAEESLWDALATTTTTTADFRDVPPDPAGPMLAWDELRQVYKMEVPDSANGVVESFYVALVATDAIDARWDIPVSERTEEELALQELSEVEARDAVDRLGTVAASDSSIVVEADGALIVTDLNSNGRLDDDTLWFSRNYYRQPDTGVSGESEESLPEMRVTENESVEPLAETQPERADLRPAAPAPGAEDGARSEQVQQPLNYYVVPMQSLLALQDTLSRQQPLSRALSESTDGIDPTNTDFLFVVPQSNVDGTAPATSHSFVNEAAPGDAPDSLRSRLLFGVGVNGQAVTGTPVGVPGSDSDEESLRRLGEQQAGATRQRFSTFERRRVDVEGLAEQLGQAGERGGQRRSSLRRSRETDPATEPRFEDGAVRGSGSAPMPTDRARYRGDAGVVEQFLADQAAAVVAGGQRSPDTSGTTSELFREHRGEGEALPQQSREAAIDAWERAYRLTDSDTEEGRTVVQPGFFDPNLDIPFRQSSFDLGVPDFGGSDGWAQEDLSWEDGQWQLNFDSGGRWAYTPGTESYAPITENDFLPTLAEPVSTFSIDVDTGSYANCRRFIGNGMWPPADAVRVEEFVNSFTYNDPVPAGEHPIAVNFDIAACPWETEHRLVRIGLRASDIIRSERPATRLVFLIDVSGSMSDDNKLPLVRDSLHLLVEELNEGDRVAVVTYADEAALRLESTSGDDRETILAAVDALGANGSTNGEGGLRLAYQVAEQQIVDEGSNRVILCTDGDFNVGESDDSELVKLIEERRESGVFLSVFGFGTGNLKDAKLEQIADHGNGHYGYIDSLDEAKNVFVHDLTGTLYTVAKDVKLQVDFNPTQVESYRLIGYENRQLENVDFDNDIVDAGDVGAGHSVTALYEVAPRSRSEETDPAELAQAALDRFVRISEDVEDNVRIDREGSVYNLNGIVVSEQRREDTFNFVTTSLSIPEFENVEVRNNLEVVETDELPVTGDDLLKLRVRYKRPNEDESRLFESVLVDDGTMQSPSADFQWSTAVASYGLLLRQSRFRGDTTFDAILETARAAVEDDPLGQRQEFIDLVRQSQTLYARQTAPPEPGPAELSSIEALETATCGNKYSNLLDKREVREDLETYGEFSDYGYWEGDTYREFTGLPAGYWVYVYPHWYIWGESE